MNTYLYDLKKNNSAELQHFKWFCILFTMYIVIYPLEINFLFRIIMFGIYIVELFIIFNQLVKNKMEKKQFLPVVICLSLLLFEFIYYEIPITLDSIQTIACFILFILMTCAQRNIVCIEEMHRVLLKTGIICSIILSIYSFFPFAYYFRGTTTICTLLSLNLENANFTGIVLFSLLSILWIERRRSRFKGLLYILMLYMLYMIYLTGSRTSLATVAIIFVFSILFSKKKIYNMLIILVETIPFIFLPIYIYLSTIQQGTLMFMGKRVFSGRQDIYARYLSYMQDGIKWWIGNMKDIFFYNTGNGPFAILCSTGIIVTICVYFLYIRSIIQSNSKVRTTEGKIAIISLLSIAIHTCSESSMVLGGIMSVFFHYVLFVISHDEFKETNI